MAHPRMLCRGRIGESRPATSDQSAAGAGKRRTAIRLGRAAGFLSLWALAVAAVHADSPTDTWITGSTSLFKNTNWTGATTPPVGGVTGIISDNTTKNPLGWNSNTNPGAQTFGDLDFTSPAVNLVVGNYTTKTTNVAINITLAGSTLNSMANTIMANSSGSTIVFRNDVVPPGDFSTEAATTTFTLGNPANIIQTTPGSKFIIDNVITGAGDSLTLLGGGNSTTTGGSRSNSGRDRSTTWLAAWPNAPTQSAAGTFTGTAVVETSDQNSFTGGLTIGDTISQCRHG